MADNSGASPAPLSSEEHRGLASRAPEYGEQPWFLAGQCQRPRVRHLHGSHLIYPPREAAGLARTVSTPSTDLCKRSARDERPPRRKAPMTFQTDPSMTRSIRNTLIVECARTGLLVASADGDAGRWYCASRSADVALGSACASAAYGDPIGDATPDGPAAAIAVLRARESLPRLRAEWLAACDAVEGAQGMGWSAAHMAKLDAAALAAFDAYNAADMLAQ